MHLFVTNREIIEQEDGSETVREDGKERACEFLRFGTYSDEKFHVFREPKRLSEVNYEKLDAYRTDELKGSAAFFKTLYDAMAQPGSNKNDVLFFVHGFNTDLNGVRQAFKNLEECYVKPEGSTIGHIVIFTWPGKEQKLPLHYHDDKTDAILSGTALARALQKTADFLHQHIQVEENKACGCKMHLMAHSMGNLVLKHAMLHLQRDGGHAPELFNQILLMAADVEFDIFEPGKPFDNLIDLGYRITVYQHERDHVLGISKYTKNFSNRLGQHGRKRKQAEEDIVDADVSSTTDDLDNSIRADKLNHWYYYSSSEVVRDVCKVLGGGKTLF
jgi:esterase/lipase superfamily enzyme